MAVGEDFATFCSNIAVRDRDSISQRYQQLTRRLNIEFWSTESYTAHSRYLGSYGRGTAVGLTSDVDMVMELPYEVYKQYDAWQGNGQSGLLQSVRAAIKKTYSFTDVGADGQVVVVPFTDGITFEVLPGFVNTDGSYTFPDANSGGRWRTANPRPEIAAIDARDASCNYNLKLLCRMARAWKAQWDVPISGLLIDTMAYNFIGTWEYRDKSYLYYDWMSRDFFAYLAGQSEAQTYWLSPGAGQYVWRTGKFEYKATRCHNIAVDAIKYAANNQTWSARQAWREIYGTSYPS
jgi:hypothetical protein